MILLPAWFLAQRDLLRSHAQAKTKDPNICVDQPDLGTLAHHSKGTVEHHLAEEVHVTGPSSHAVRDQTTTLPEHKMLLGVSEDHEDDAEAVELDGDEDALIARVLLGLTTTHHPVADEVVGSEDELGHKDRRDECGLAAEASIRESPVLNVPHKAIVAMEAGIDPGAKREIIKVVHHGEQVEQHGTLIEVDDCVEWDELGAGRHAIA